MHKELKKKVQYFLIKKIIGGNIDDYQQAVRELDNLIDSVDDIFIKSKLEKLRNQLNQKKTENIIKQTLGVLKKRLKKEIIKNHPDKHMDEYEKYNEITKILNNVNRNAPDLAYKILENRKYFFGNDEEDEKEKKYITPYNITQQILPYNVTQQTLDIIPSFPSVTKDENKNIKKINFMSFAKSYSKNLNIPLKEAMKSDDIKAEYYRLIGKKQPAKKQPAKKQPAKKQPAKKQPAKKQPAKKQPAKKKQTKRENLYLRDRIFPNKKSKHNIRKLTEEDKIKLSRYLKRALGAGNY
jgi:hypothetical protein